MVKEPLYSYVSEVDGEGEPPEPVNEDKYVWTSLRALAVVDVIACVSRGVDLEFRLSLSLHHGGHVGDAE